MKKFIKTGALTAAVMLTGILAATAAAFPASSHTDKASAWAVAENEALVGETDNIDAGFSVEAERAAVLKTGSKGGEVKEVQRRLKQWGYYKGEADGIFGAGTKAAVIAFQKKNG